MNKNIIQIGSNTFDFEKNFYKTSSIVFTEGFKIYSGGTAKLPISSITGIEIHKPFLTRVGIVKFIINGKRYIHHDSTKPLEDYLFSMSEFKKEFHVLMQIVERIKEVNPDCDVRMCKGLKLAFDVPIVKYNGEFIVDRGFLYKDMTPEKIDNTPYTPPKVYTDYESPVKKDSSVIGSAIVGGVVAGPAGAVVGALHAVNKNNKNK